MIIEREFDLKYLDNHFVFLFHFAHEKTYILGGRAVVANIFVKGILLWTIVTVNPKYVFSPLFFKNMFSLCIYLYI